MFSILYDTAKNIVQPTEFPHSPDAPQEPPSWAKSAREACNIFLKKIADSIPDQGEFRSQNYRVSKEMHSI